MNTYLQKIMKQKLEMKNVSFDRIKSDKNLLWCSQKRPQFLTSQQTNVHSSFVSALVPEVYFSDKFWYDTYI